MESNYRVGKEENDRGTGKSRENSENYNGERLIHINHINTNFPQPNVHSYPS